VPSDRLAEQIRGFDGWSWVSARTSGVGRQSELAPRSKLGCGNVYSIELGSAGRDEVIPAVVGEGPRGETGHSLFPLLNILLSYPDA